MSFPHFNGKDCEMHCLDQAGDGEHSCK